MTQKTKKQSEADEIIVNIAIALGFIITVNAKILWKGLSKLKIYPALVGVASFLLISWILTRNDYHLRFLLWIDPDIFHYDLMVKLKSYGLKENVLSLAGLFSLISLWLMGVMPMIRLRRYQNALDDVSLKNAKDFKPKVVAAWREDQYHKVVKVMVPGIGAEGLRKVKDKLEASFETPIEEVRSCKNPKYAEIVLGGRDLPSNISYSGLEAGLNSSGTFLIGESKKGIVKEKIDNLPHMMIAGTVGGGKSVFFKQAILGLLSSTNNLQMYLIDLKGGLEFRSFAALPNVKVAKTIEEAVALLPL